MNKERLKRLEEKGWKKTTVKDFLQLTDEENTEVEKRVKEDKLLKLRNDLVRAQYCHHHFAIMVISSQIKVLEESK